MRIEFTPEFKRNLRALAKKYRNIKMDVAPIIDKLAVGETVGQQIPGVNYPVFKLRINNSDIQKGRSSGYRMIYFFKSPQEIVLVTIYSKLDQQDISPKTIRRIIENLET
jgi:mRNA-degrading endonuclease RelE of RelBE toxin-antitoxin system